MAVALLLAGAGGCDVDKSSGIRAPFQARYADLELQVTDRPDLYQATKYDLGVHIRICNREVSDDDRPPSGCDGLVAPVVNRYGISTFITEPVAGFKDRGARKQFKLLSERPLNAPIPPAEPLVPIAEELIADDFGGATEAYELRRLSVLDPEAPLTTTIHGWPMARCASHPLGSRYCSIGFLIRGAFVEAQVFAEEGVPLNQKQVWNVASALDAKLRALAPRPSS